MEDREKIVSEFYHAFLNGQINLKAMTETASAIANKYANCDPNALYYSEDSEDNWENSLVEEVAKALRIPSDWVEFSIMNDDSNCIRIAVRPPIIVTHLHLSNED